jgi:hypothetical protein
MVSDDQKGNTNGGFGEQTYTSQKSGIFIITFLLFLLGGSKYTPSSPSCANGILDKGGKVR